MQSYQLKLLSMYKDELISADIYKEELKDYDITLNCSRQISQNKIFFDDNISRYGDGIFVFI